VFIGARSARALKSFNPKRAIKIATLAIPLSLCEKSPSSCAVRNASARGSIGYYVKLGWSATFKAASWLICEENTCFLSPGALEITIESGFLPVFDLLIYSIGTVHSITSQIILFLIANDQWECPELFYLFVWRSAGEWIIFWCYISSAGSWGVDSLSLLILHSVLLVNIHCSTDLSIKVSSAQKFALSWNSITKSAL
jgi:hypothetical protein